MAGGLGEDYLVLIMAKSLLELTLSRLHTCTYIHAHPAKSWYWRDVYFSFLPILIFSNLIEAYPSLSL
jgi:hypothetical protein